MNDIITVENTEMQIREYNGQRVVTFKDIDTVHCNKKDTAKRNFSRNKKHFIEDIDFIVATREKLKRDNLTLLNISIPTRGITLLTETGYLMIAKSLTDDLSWQVQRQLVNTYFKVKEQQEIKLEDTAKPEPLTEFPNYPTPVFQTSSTPVPKNPNWYARNRRRMNMICQHMNCPLSTLYHFLLVRLGEEYNLDAANQIYAKEIGHAPKYPLDIVSYFPELGKMADALLDLLEKNMNKK